MKRHCNRYCERHIGPQQEQLEEMLQTMGLTSLDELIDQTIPAKIRLQTDLNLPNPMEEQEFLNHIKNIAGQNKTAKSYIGLGYYNTLTPSVILRNIFENPGWYTQYTPYQSEISQGRLEALLNFQTMILDLTGMQVANASLLDEATAAAEAMAMLHRLRSKEKIKMNAHRFFISRDTLPQTIDVLKTRAEPLGIELVIDDLDSFAADQDIFGLLLQFPDQKGQVYEYEQLISKAHAGGCLTVVAVDLLSLALFTPPGEFGADVVVGSAQRFGVPLGFGGPHAAFFATRDEFTRQMPGRVIGVSVDRLGNKGYRMALQTREQHIRREKATSNICTAQALLAIMAGMYAVYHGPQGLQNIAAAIHEKACTLDDHLSKIGCKQLNPLYFDTLLLSLSAEKLPALRQAAEKAAINFRYVDQEHISIAVDESTNMDDIRQIIELFAAALGAPAHFSVDHKTRLTLPKSLQRTTTYLQHPVFNIHHSETAMMRYIKSLENKDLSLTQSMIPLGSCTMKLNTATAMLPVSWPEFAGVHPFVPSDQVQGYLGMISELEGYLSEITGLAATSLQPNSGAQGEFTGLMVIRAAHRDHGQHHRRITLIPASAHGTNPASAIMAGMEVVLVNCDEKGNINIADLRQKAEEHRENLAALMVTYPSTHGVFEEDIIEICTIIHQNGGLVYMDGANMNAQVGLTSPGKIGADVCHLNLHKTFSIPHGGGGPGVGPICVSKALAPYLPGHCLVKTGGEKAIPAIAATPWGSAGILLISYAYIRMLGASGMKEVTKTAILNANYLFSRLKEYYPVVYTGARGRVAHELIFDMRHFKKEAGVEVEDIAKRLMDYSFHAPTVAWPVHGTLMVEPTESEPKEELDRFCDAMIAIYHEMEQIREGKLDVNDNMLKNAPHPAAEAIADDWNHPYSRETAVYPLKSLKQQKFWPPVARIDNTYGDRNLVCSCPPLESYLSAEV